MSGLARLIGTVGYVGYLRPAPGTWGTLAALPLAYAVYWLGGIWLFLLAIPVAYLKGLWATRVMTEGQEEHDPSEIVVDELVGVWIALLPVAWGAARTGLDPLAMWPGIVAAFVLFRLFDIWKPGPVGTMDKRNDHWGVMLDDVVAGIMAAMGVALLAAVAHGVLM